MVISRNLAAMTDAVMSVEGTLVAICYSAAQKMAKDVAGRTASKLTTLAPTKLGLQRHGSNL